MALLEISVMVAANSSTELAWVMEPWLRVCAPMDTWLLAEETWAAEALICRMVPLSSCFSVRMDWRMFRKSPT